MLNKLVITIFFVLLLFGVLSISTLWVDVFQNYGRKIGWCKENSLGSFYLAAVVTVVFISLLIILEYYDVGFYSVVNKL